VAQRWATYEEMATRGPSRFPANASKGEPPDAGAADGQAAPDGPGITGRLAGTPGGS